MLRFMPPAGSPIKMAEVFGAFRTYLSPANGQDDCFREIQRLLGVTAVLGISSGRAGLWLALKALKNLRPDRHVVALPAYTCFTVPAAIVRADLKLYPVEVDPESLDFDYSSLSKVPQDGLLAVVTSNLFGMANDVSRTLEIARRKGAFVIDDAAQALGATRNGHSAGTTGDIGIYSLGRGKALTAIEGGLIVTKSAQLGTALMREAAGLVAASPVHTAALLMKMFGYSLLLSPRVYWIPNSLPFLKLGTTEFNPEFVITEMPRLCEALLNYTFAGLPELNRKRNENAAALAKSLCKLPAFSLMKPAADSRPSYIRFPVLANDQATRDRAVAKLRAAGIGASAFYPSAICDIKGISKCMTDADYHCPIAEDISRRLLTLPTHPFVKERDLQTMVRILEKVGSQ